MKIWSNWLTDKYLDFNGWFYKEKEGVAPATGATLTANIICFRTTALAAKNIPALAHELVHTDQIAKEGIWKMRFKYMLYWVKYGYAKNPYEIEAYTKMNDVFYMSRAKKILE